MNRTVLSFLAHPDDAEILCGGPLIRLSQLGWRVHIVTCTPGDCGSTDKDAQTISAIRRREAADAAAMIGASYHCLEERDGRVVYDKSTLDKTYDLFRQISPSLVFSHPREDYMRDHEVAHQLVRAASFLYSAPNVSLVPLAGPGSVPWVYYCDPIGGVDPLGKPVTPTTRVDVSAVMDQKAKMLLCHASQREWLRAHHGMDEYVEAMKREGRKRGAEIGSTYAEGFIQHRGHAYPESDLLAELGIASSQRHLA